MANRTVKDAKSVRGTNPQFLIEKIIRSRIYECKFWKEECFALSAELIVDKAMELRYIGGVFGGNIKPTPFLCLILKMLQIQPEKDIIVEFIKNEEFKYVRALGAMYMRLVGTSIEIYKYLEPLLNDGRKLRMQGRDGQFVLIHVDEYIDGLLHDERQFDIILPRIQKRHVLEETNELEARVSALEDDADENAESSEEEEEKQARPEKKRSPLRSKDNERKEKKREKEKRERREEKHRERSRSRSRERRHRSRTPERRQERKEERKRHHERDRYDRDDHRHEREDHRHDREDHRHDREDHRHERDDRYDKNDRYERDDRDRYDREDRDRHKRDDRDRYDRDSRDDRRRDRDKR